MVHSSDPLPSMAEETMGRGGRREDPRDPLEKMMAVGVRAQNEEKYNVMLGISAAAPAVHRGWSPIIVSGNRISAASFQLFPGNKF